MTDKLQEVADRLVRNEVKACVSALVSTLARGYAAPHRRPHDSSGGALDRGRPTRPAG